MDVLMPRLSDSMEEGTIVAWLAEDGATVAEGEDIVEIETDKATLSCAAETAGTLKILAEVGLTLPLGAPIARIQTVAEGEGGNGTGSARPREAAAKPEQPAAPRVAPGRGERVLASPVARRIASEHDIDLVSLEGTGPQGRVMKRDVVRAAAERRPAAGDHAPSSAADPARDATRIERLVAARMVQSSSDIPVFTVSVDAEVDPLIAFRGELKSIVGDDGFVPSVTDLIIKACAFQLRRQPRVNAHWKDNRIIEFAEVNVGVAVATDDGGLVVPVIRNADQRSLGDVARASQELIARARSGRSTPQDFEEGTFTVSNLGTHGVSSFTAIITPGQGAILAVGATHPTPVENNGEFAIRRVITLTLSSDHRLIYGAQAAAFVVGVKNLLEHPVAMAL